MKRTIRGLALLVLALCAGVPAVAQDERPTSPALERAIVVEELEHDRRQAIGLYAALAADEALADALRRHAALRLGRAHAVLGELDAARLALAQAAVGDDALAALARAELEDPGADEERARALREEARRWIAAIPDADFANDLSNHEPTRNLLWIGRAAVPEIVRAIDAQRAAGDRYTPVTTNLAALLWRIGGPEAAAWLDALRVDDEVELRRKVARGLMGDNARDDEMVVIAQRYLADPDPEGIVPIEALGRSGSRWQRYDAEAILALVDSPVSAVRVEALGLVSVGFRQMRHAEGEVAAMDRFVPRLSRALDDVNPEVGRAASDVLARLGLLSPASRALLVERLPGFGPDFALKHAETLQLSADEPAIQGLPRLLRLVGPASQTSRDASVSGLFASARDVLDRADVELVLESLRLGYGQEAPANWIVQHCGAEEAERICAAMREPRAMEPLLERLEHIQVTPECFPHLLAVERILDARDPQAAAREPEGTRVVLLTAMGRTATPEAVAHLVEVSSAHPGVNRYQVIAHALLRAVARRPEPDVIAALRDVLVQPIGDDTSTDVAVARQLVFAGLVHYGDPRAFELLPTAFELGMSLAPLSEPLFPHAQQFSGWQSSGVGWLHAVTRDGEVIHFHAYDEAELVSIWDALLGAPRGEAWNSAWSVLPRALHIDWNRSTSWRGHAIPLYIEPPARLVEVAARRWAERAAQERGVLADSDRPGLILLLEFARVRAVEDAAALAALAELRAACLASPSEEVRGLAIDMLPADLDAAARDALQRALSDPSMRVSRSAFDIALSTRQPVSRELFARVLAHPWVEMRTRAIDSLAPLVAEGAVELVKGALVDPVADVRVAACRFLGTQVDADSVPELLAALTDIDEGVRTAAADALRAIRFYHDERSHWDRVFAGTELSANGAAEALLKQAGTESPRDVRLLAIRSLGTLGVAETLPFLIEWTADPDAELAAAARAAIARIHTAGD